MGLFPTNEVYSSDLMIPGSFSFNSPANPAPVPVMGAFRGAVLGAAPSPAPIGTVTLFTPTAGKGSSCSACAGSSSDSSSGASQADLFSPEGESKLCGKCLCTWILAALLLVVLVFYVGDDEGRE